MIARIQIGFDRHEQLGGGVRELAQDGLTSYDDDLPIIGDRGGGAKEVLQLRALQGAIRSRTSRHTLQRVRGSMTPAKGEH